MLEKSCFRIFISVVEERKEEAFLSTDFLNAVEQKKQEAEQW